MISFCTKREGQMIYSDFIHIFQTVGEPQPLNEWKWNTARLRKCTVSHISSDQKAPGGFLQKSWAVDGNRPQFTVDMRWSTTSRRGLRETEKNVHAPGSQTKRNASSDVLPPEMPPLWCGPPASSSAPCSRLWASIGSAWWMCALSPSHTHTAKAAAHSKHSAFIITSSLLPKPDCEPCTSAACPHLGRGRCYDQKLDVTSLVMLAHSEHRSGPALWNSDGFASLPSLWRIS